MSWTMGKPETVTQKELDARWGGAKPGQRFFCGWCGYKFKLGDYWRFIVGGKTKGAVANSFICKDCDKDSPVNTRKKQSRIFRLVDRYDRAKVREISKLIDKAEGAGQ